MNKISKQKKQIASLKEAFTTAVSIAINYRHLHRDYEPDDRRPVMIRKINEAHYERLTQSFKTVGDVSGLIRKWPRSGNVFPFLHVAGTSALDVIYKFTNAVYEDGGCFPIETADDWTFPKIKAEENVILQQLDIEAHALLHGKLMENSPGNTEARHSLDFRSVHWFGTDYSFTPNQAAAVKILWEHWENGTPEVGGDTLATNIESAARRARDIFKGHPAYNTMIIPGKTKGTFRLAKSD